MTPDSTSTFYCPVRKDTVHWESKDVFNPASVIRNDTLYLIYRAEDMVGRYNGTSRIGLAHSLDGENFTRFSEPVFYPDNDFMRAYEWEGGVEDPRIIETGSGQYIMTYTAYDGETARLCVASSSDLRRWDKHGLAFKDEQYENLWSKSGAIVCRQDGEKFIAHRIDGKYWMYWGDTNIFAATSDNLRDWSPVTGDDGELLSVIRPRNGMFDSQLVEPGPPAMLTEHGILIIYNSRNHPESGTEYLPDGTYSAGQALLNPADPVEILGRTDSYFMKPDKPYEITGQVNNVVFLEGLSFYNNRWWLYYGTADSRIAVAKSY
jgi:predicted GH43/DUF377 family glycosyl hydrolase